MMLQASIDITGKFIAAGSCWERTLGWSVGELLQTPFIARVHPDDLDTAIAAIHHLHSGGRQVSFFCRLATRDRAFIWIRWQASLLEEATRIDLLGYLQESEQNVDQVQSSH